MILKRLLLIFGVVTLLSTANTLLFSAKANAAICPEGTPNAGAEINSTVPDRIDEFCNREPEQDTGGTTVDSCGTGSFLGFPTWYKYIQGTINQNELTGQPECQPMLNGLNDIWKIVAAVIEILLRVAALVAIGFVVYGGVTYTTSQGQPDKTKKALQTIISAVVGLIISVVATAFITFIAGRF